MELLLFSIDNTFVHHGVYFVTQCVYIQPMFNGNNYRSILKEILAEKSKKNSSYSLRAFAGQLGIAPSMLSNVLKGSKNLSVESAFAVAQKLNLSAQQTDLFCLLVQLETTKSIAQKELLLAKIQNLRPSEPARDLSLDLFKSMADWTHVAALILLELPNLATADLKTIATRLGITTVQADLVLERLVRLELVQPDDLGNYERVNRDHLMTRSEIANPALKEFHRSMLTKAIESLETQSPKEKSVGSETMTFDPARLPEVNAILEEAYAKVKALASEGSSQKEIYHLGIQFFRLTQSSETKPQRPQIQTPKKEKSK
jgi:uncharacterized protein (TIGR02147 family)